MSQNINIYAIKKEKSTENCFSRPDFYQRVSSTADIMGNKYRRHVSTNMLSTSATSSCGSTAKRNGTVMKGPTGKQKMYNNADIEEYTSLTVKRKSRVVTSSTTTDTTSYTLNGRRCRKPTGLVPKLNLANNNEAMEEVTVPQQSTGSHCLESLTPIESLIPPVSLLEPIDIK